MAQRIAIRKPVGAVIAPVDARALGVVDLDGAEIGLDALCVGDDHTDTAPTGFLIAIR